MSRRTKYSTGESFEDSIWSSEGSDLGHDFYVNRLFESVKERAHAGHRLGPGKEDHYPEEFDFHGSHREGEFDVYIGDSNDLVVYEVKNTKNYLDDIFRKYRAAENFASTNGMDLDFYVVLSPEIYGEVGEAIEKADLDMPGRFVGGEQIKEHLNGRVVQEMVKGGFLSQIDWLRSGFRDREGHPPRFDDLDEDLVDRDEHIYFGSEKLFELEETMDEIDVLYLGPLWDSTYPADEIEELLGQSLPD